MKVEWEYLAVMGIVAFLSFVGYNQGLISDIHTLFGIGGMALTLMVIIGFKADISKMNVGNFLIQAAILNFVLGFPAIVHQAERIPYAPEPYVVLVATATEEILRIAAFLIVAIAFEMPKFAVGISSVVFAAIHLYWYPTEWFSAIVAGALFSVLLLYYGSQTACVASHFTYDILAFGYLPFFYYVIISCIMLILGYFLNKKKVEI